MFQIIGKRTAYQIKVLVKNRLRTCIKGQSGLRSTRRLIPKFYSFEL